MIRTPLILLSVALSACGTPSMKEPSLAHRPAESIDPRAPVPNEIPTGTVDASLSSQLAALVAAAHDGAPEFERRASEARALAANAGPMASESWIAAQQSLSRLVEQLGVTSRAAADIDKLAADRLQANKWLSPADQAEIRQAQAAIAAIAAPQTEEIDRLREQLAR